MHARVQYRVFKKQSGISTFSVLITAALSSMVLSAVFNFYLQITTYVHAEVAKRRANEAAVGAAWFAVDYLSANPAPVNGALAYPGQIAPDLSISIQILSLNSTAEQITVNAAIQAPNSSTRRIVVLYSPLTKQVTAWKET